MRLFDWVGRRLSTSLMYAQGSCPFIRADWIKLITAAARLYGVVGQVFFASSETFLSAFDFKEVVPRVRIDVTRAHFWDITAVGALDKVVLKFRREGTGVEVIGMDEASSTLVDRFTIHDKPGAVEQLMH